MSKRKRKIKNPVAESLNDPTFAQQRINGRNRYDRKRFKKLTKKQTHDQKEFDNYN